MFLKFIQVNLQQGGAEVSARQLVISSCLKPSNPIFKVCKKVDLKQKFAKLSGMKFCKFDKRIFTMTISQKRSIKKIYTEFVLSDILTSSTCLIWALWQLGWLWDAIWYKPVVLQSGFRDYQCKKVYMVLRLNICEVDGAKGLREDCDGWCSEDWANFGLVSCPTWWNLFHISPPI